MAILTAAPAQPPPPTDRASTTSVSPIRSIQPPFETVEELHWKVRIAFLWLFLAVGMSAMMILTIMEPGVISQALVGKLPNGEDITPTMTMMFAAFWLIPLAMAILTLMVKDSISRPANAVVGLLAAVIWFTDYFEGQAFGGASVVTAGIVLAGLLIAWHAWKWPHARSMSGPTG